MQGITSVNVVKRNELGQILPGQVSLNPAGKPVGTKHFETLFRTAIKNIAEGQKDSDDIRIVRKVVSKAVEGDLKAAEMVMDRTDGKLANATPDGGGNVTFNVIQFTGDIVNGNIPPQDLS